MTYAEKTTVPPERSRAEIERTLARYGAQRFASGYEATRALMMFEAHGRRVRFDLPLPDVESFMPKDGEKPPHGWRSWTEPKRRAWAAKQREQLTCARWRALVLCIKAKLEAVESGITTFEAEFLAHIVLPTGETLGEWAVPQLDRAASIGKLPPMLPRGRHEAG